MQYFVTNILHESVVGNRFEFHIIGIRFISVSNLFRFSTTKFDYRYLPLCCADLPESDQSVRSIATTTKVN